MASNHRLLVHYRPIVATSRTLLFDLVRHRLLLLYVRFVVEIEEQHKHEEVLRKNYKQWPLGEVAIRLESQHKPLQEY